MKKRMLLVGLLALVTALSGCGKEAENPAPTAAPTQEANPFEDEISDVPAAWNEAEAASDLGEINPFDAELGMLASDDAGLGAPSSEDAPAAPSSDAGVDLTRLSSTMVYAEVNNMLTNPEDYLGKTVKMRGEFSVFASANDPSFEYEREYYCAVIIADATACCEQGIEFILKGDPAYPDAYPEPGSQVTVQGEFSTYVEGGYLYCYLINAEIV